MSLELRSQYWDDRAAREAFKKFVIEIHNLDFTTWEEAGFWDDAYTPFTLFEGDEIVSSMCVYLLDAVVDGRRTRLAQVSAMGTRAERRGQGLGRRVLEAGLDWADGRNEGVFLFSDEDAVGFYERCGFRPVEEHAEVVDAPPVPPRPGAVKLDPGREEDLARIHAYARRRTPVSDAFAMVNEKLLMFHALYLLRDCAYEIPELECLAFFRRTNGTLRLYDVVGARMPRFEDLYPFLAAAGDREVEFHFATDKLGVGRPRRRSLTGNFPFVGPGFPVERPVFPYTSLA